ncbi:hypothetical protein ACW4EZ_24235 [Bacillus toyonensis]|uniref:Uncharacterized protein n=1 Tax=Bacillus toyonensis TaxID=155322 RepID=A0A2B6ASM2_9BACI|nr:MULTISPECIES: hypothetical protein [Bacillus]AFU15446.1 hypothetical protein MC28_4024 [Bacillus thuringiensis MC28]EEL59109.1 hypothetical protein bcere0024_032600 [Bacillus cereus Rock4-18]EJR68604.1 hypothetical protein IIO_00132 [Bacillus cereus VD115]OTW78424.1 hypothetical protein BK702_29505 [Bacillus thuringiensis serovar cameroun]OTX05048.1 hypothetical protein BK712_17955 [Bacillus thuringiensis serovar seoulensis]OTX31169.1 hypothetical protein BK717_21395 [Bacillus thuringiensi
MQKEDGSLFEVISIALRSKEVLLFSSLSLVIFLTATYFYNSKFPNHKYPEFLGALKYIASIV